MFINILTNPSITLDHVIETNCIIKSNSTVFKAAIWSLASEISNTIILRNYWLLPLLESLAFVGVRSSAGWRSVRQAAGGTYVTCRATSSAWPVSQTAQCAALSEGTQPWHRDKCNLKESCSFRYRTSLLSKHDSDAFIERTLTG